VLASLALMATVLSCDAVPALEEGSDVYSDRVAQLVVALAQADADFSLKQEELGLTGAAPLVGLGDKAEPAPPTASAAPPASARPAASGRSAPAAKPASAKNR
jgi:hypothetical protein